MTLYKLAASNITTSADGVASLDFVQAGKIVGVHWNADWQSTSGACVRGRFELSFGSSNTILTNDTRQAVSTHSIGAPLVAATVQHGGNTSDVGNLDADVAAGERIFLHWEADVTPGEVNVTCHLYVEDKGSRAALNRR